jgi:hypothetical protein
MISLLFEKSILRGELCAAPITHEEVELLSEVVADEQAHTRQRRNDPGERRGDRIA